MGEGELRRCYTREHRPGHAHSGETNTRVEQSVCEYLHGCLVQIGMHAFELLDLVFKTRTMHLRGMSKYAVLAAACGLEFLESVAADSSCLRPNANIMHSAFLM